MAMIYINRGFALLIAVIFMSVMLTFGLALGSLAYKQSILSSTALESQYAFYTADGALECALYADQQNPGGSLFAYPSQQPSAAPTLYCNGYPPYSNFAPTIYWDSQKVVYKYRIYLSDLNNTCADVTIYKANPSNPPSWGNGTYIFSQGYDVSCPVVDSVASGSGARMASRGLETHY